MNETPRDARKSHADGATTPLAETAEPTLAEKARTLVEQGGPSMLSTVSRKHKGYPFGSIVPYGLTAEGEPTFLMSSMAMHTRNVLDDPRATLLVSQELVESNPLGGARISLMGDVTPIDDEAERSSVVKNYLARNPSAEAWIHYGDFRFFRMSLRDVYFVGGFGVMGWIAPTEFLAAQPDPLADAADGIIEHMNQDHADALIRLAHHFHGINALQARMMQIDRLGFRLKLQTTDGPKGVRIPFDPEVSHADQVRQRLVAMLSQIRG